MIFVNKMQVTNIAIFSTKKRTFLNQSSFKRVDKLTDIKIVM
jgi:hypothetical protein